LSGFSRQIVIQPATHQKAFSKREIFHHGHIQILLEWKENMKAGNKLNPKKQQSSGQFFRDIEIEFLVHELKGPIAVIETGMRTLLEKAEKYGPLTPRQEKVLKRSLRNSRKAREMLNGLLEIGRSEADCFLCCRFQPANSAYDVLLDTLETVTGSEFDQIEREPGKGEVLTILTQKGIYLDVSPQVSESEMHQDENKFRHIIGNLIQNALHHRRERLEIRMNRIDDQIFVEITDDGPGIDPEHHEAVFQRYTQLKECAISPRNGHGLGLAGARILARCLGGDIELESEKGKGATFRLILPLKFVRDEE
jgi:signal transduction histidine kinase